ncbi:MAG TPA: M13-type metalloendopeptidase [Propionibacteriaceae bacterium]|nr:M13-type metalloendopeptidase [Propionibacteriaceae bacterium]
MTTPALDLTAFDLSVRPTDDLYRHVNGTWLATARIDADKAQAGAFVELRDASEAAVRDIITSLDDELDPATEAGKIAALYADFMDADTIEALGASPLAPVLARVDAIDTVEALGLHWGWSERHGLRHLLGLDVDADPGDPQRYVLFAGQSGLGLPDEEYYRDEQYASIRDAYLTHVERTLALAGRTEAAAEARRVLELETQIAACHWDKVTTRDLRKMYNPQSWDEFTASSPTLPWDAFLAGAELEASALGTLVNAQPSFFTDVAALVTEERLDDWRAWARWKAASSLSSFLSSAFVDQRFDFYERTLNGVEQLRDRWKRGVAFVEGTLGESIGKIYVDRHFPPAAKERMDTLVANLLAAYRQSIESLDWMTEETRAQALDKLSKFRPKIGYPATWRDFSTLTVVPGDLVGNLMRAAEFEFDFHTSKLAGPVDPEEWFMFPQTVNAYYHPLRNEIVFPAAILQPPFFNLDADDAVNYGGIGAVIGHEIGHGFDDQGSTCDGDGVLRDWWTDADRTAFEARTKALIGQFDALVPEQTPDVHVNGALTIGENIGDLGGAGIALRAWQIATDGTDPQPIDGWSGVQRFFLSYAAIWQGKLRTDALLQRLATDPHSPGEFRCNQIVRNLDAFHDAFGTQPGDGLWMEPAERVRIW